MSGWLSSIILPSFVNLFSWGGRGLHEDTWLFGWQHLGISAFRGSIHSFITYYINYEILEC